jgi:kynureninase
MQVTITAEWQPDFSGADLDIAGLTAWVHDKGDFVTWNVNHTDTNIYIDSGAAGTIDDAKDMAEAAIKKHLES